ncbi:hypothetical protein OG478_20095 [Streptomyces phaeochromogenes]|nr:hypothetical protein OG478_20095 [Streptomyces phaeochromogenes]
MSLTWQGSLVALNPQARVQGRRECSMSPIFAATVSAEPRAYCESIAS